MESLGSGRRASAPHARLPWPSSKTLSYIALALWVSSLALTGIVLYHEQQRIVGAQILAMGWLSPLVGNFAWFANPLFLWALLRLQIGKPARGPALVAVLLSLDTFRFSNFLLNEGGGSTPVYGYGWGAVLWFAAISILASAIGTRQIEGRLQANRDAGIDEWLRPIGFVLCSSMLAAVGYLATQDRMLAKGAERQRLSGLAFKRGPVCRAEEPTVSQPLAGLSGPLEVTLSEGPNTGTLYPFGQTTDLLKWGIPVVRVAGRDYSYVAAGNGQILTSVPASGPPAAVLAVVASVVDGRRQLQAKLVEHATGRIVFDQVWRKEASGASDCPGYSPFPKNGEQPRKLLLEGLAVQSLSTEVPGARELPALNRANAEVITLVDAPALNEQGNQQTETSAATRGGMRGARRPWQGNHNCPDNIGWDGWGSGSPARLNTGWPFMVGDTAFYPGTRGQYNALCAGEFAYLFAGDATDGRYYLSIEKRRLSDFERVWSGIAVVQDPSLATPGAVLRVDSVSEGAAGVTIGLTQERTGRKAVIRAALRLPEQAR